MPLKMDLGGSWAPFGRGLGRSGPSFGHFWMLFGNFLEVLSPPFFKHRSGMGSRRPFGSVLLLFPSTFLTKYFSKNFRFQPGGPRPRTAQYETKLADGEGGLPPPALKPACYAQKRAGGSCAPAAAVAGPAGGGDRLRWKNFEI